MDRQRCTNPPGHPILSQPHGQKGRSDDAEQWGHDGFELQKKQRSPPRHEDGEYGAKVKITNLHYDVMDEDLEELFGTIGNVAKVKVAYDSAGRSSGEAIVIFLKEASAEKAVAVRPSS